MFALNFVADAWRDFCDRLNKLQQENVLLPQGPYSSPLAVKAWRSPSDAYHSYMVDTVYSGLMEEFVTLQDENEIKTFGDFLRFFSKFCENTIAYAGPLTYSGFIESIYSSPLNTGLVIEISDDLHSDDENKERTFLYDGNFSLVQSIATQYGFAIDKNAPWRFCADISSPVMVEYMTGVPIESNNGETKFNNYIGECNEPVLVDPTIPDPFGYSQIPGLRNVLRHANRYNPYADLQNSLYYTEKEISQVVFNVAYDPTWILDIQLLNYYLVSFYNFFVESNPYVVETPASAEYCAGPQTRVVPRVPVSPELVSSESDSYGAKWSLTIYYHLRMLERGFKKSRNERASDLQSVINRYNFSQGTAQQRLTQAVRFMQEKYIGPTPQNRMYTEEEISNIIRSSFPVTTIY